MAKGGYKLVGCIEDIKSGSLEAIGVSKIFTSVDGNEVVALSEMNFKINPGEFISLIGPSGCGKTTLLRLIAGLDKPSSGKILLDGNEIKSTSYERGLVFQNPKLYPWLTIYENIAFGLKARRVFNKDNNEVVYFIDLIGLRGFEKSYPHHISGGMAQRVALARALINHPKVLLLDEPLGALDAFTRINMQDEIIRIWKERKTTMVMVTHDVDEAIYMSDRIFVMTPRPAKVEKIIEVNLDRPRNRDSSDFINLRNEILRIMKF